MKGLLAVTVALLLLVWGKADAKPVLDEEVSDRETMLLEQLSSFSNSSIDELEKLVAEGSRKRRAALHGFATYYAARFNWRRTTTGAVYNPDLMTAAHESLPFGTVVRVLNPANNLAVHVTINDRCAPKQYNFIDLSRAAAKQIGLWGRGRIKVVIMPLIDQPLKESA